MIGKILATHLERRAVVYLRQSTLRQVFENKESTLRQYALRQRALDLGWPAALVEIIDEDLGRSGASTEGRTGFLRLAEDVAHGRIGAILMLEVSRLARDSADWHHLLDLCGLADVLLIDEQGVYCPRDDNDRLMLGLRGTMSEAELNWMRLRLQGGKLNKARRGQLRFLPPAGYQWDPQSEGPRLDADAQVQSVVRLVFERFRLTGSACGVTRYLSEHGVKLPARRADSGELYWVLPRHGRVLGILRNPFYTGAYVYGRRKECRALVEGKIQRRRLTRLTMDAWQVRLPDHHPAYVSWEQYMANQHKLDANRTARTSLDRRGAAREGAALLQGLVLCGRCGHRMATSYQGRDHRPAYECRAPMRHTGRPTMCWSVVAGPIDRAVAELFLATVTPPEIDLTLALTREVERQAAELDRQWALRMDRLRYEVRLAERRYKAVDPDHRVVARTLEREWNDRLEDLAEAEREQQQARRENKLDLSDADRAKLVGLAKDLPRVWQAETTTNAERKNLLRLVVREVTLCPIEVPDCATRVQVQWQTDAVSELTIPRPKVRVAGGIKPWVVELISRRFAEGKSDRQITAELNAHGRRTGRRKPWTVPTVRWVRHRHGIRRPHQPPPNQRCPDRRSDGLYSVHGVAARFGVTRHRVYYWIHRGWLRGVEGGGGGRTWWFKLDAATVHRLERVRTRSDESKRGRNSETRSRNEGHYA